MSANSKAVTRWKHRTKLKLVIAFGSKCGICGYEKCVDAFDFHHIDPDDKDLTISRLLTNIVSIRKVVTEAKKCALLCSNCHREVHSTRCTPRISLVPSFNEEKFWEVHAGIHEDCPMDECPTCGKSKPIWNLVCSKKCALHPNRINWDTYDALELYKTHTVEEISKIVGCSMAAVSRRLKFLDPDLTKRFKVITQNPRYTTVKSSGIKKSLARKKIMSSIDIDTTHALYQELKTFEAVGRKLGVTGAAIKRRLKKAGLLCKNKS